VIKWEELRGKYVQIYRCFEDKILVQGHQKLLMINGEYK
jgi:hypothetical protein